MSTMMTLKRTINTIGLFVAMLFLSTQAKAISLPDDKYDHLSIGFLIGSLSTKIMVMEYIVDLKVVEYGGAEGKFLVYDKKSRLRDFWFYAIPFATVVTFALIKELTDVTFDEGDFLYSVLGGIGGITLISW